LLASYYLTVTFNRAWPQLFQALDTPSPFGKAAKFIGYYAMGNVMGSVCSSGPVPVEQVLAMYVDGEFASDVATQRKVLDAALPSGFRKLSQQDQRAATDKELRKHGVDTPTPSHVNIDDLRNALAAVTLDTFWQRNAKIHPNYGRVKNWLYVHQKYREQLDDLVVESQKVCANSDVRCCLYNPADPQAARLQVRYDAEEHFDKFVRKQKEHSEFEDTQLFAFFKKEGPTMYGKDDARQLLTALEGLSGDHDTNAHIFVKKAFTEYDNKKSGGKWQQERQIGLQIDAYNTVVKQHLDREENVMVRRWLELTEDQYKEYRSYLSLKYAVIY